MRLSALLAAFAAAVLAAPTDPVQPMQTNQTVETTQPTTSAIPAVPTSAVASPDVILKNHCPFPVYVTSVGQGGPKAPTREILAGATWSEPQYWSGTGTALDITRYAEDIWTSAAVLVLGYTYKAGESIFYDINVHAGNPFPGATIKLSGAGGETVWNKDPQPPQTKAFFGETDLTLDLCL
jgi:hypothetical protein